MADVVTLVILISDWINSALILLLVFALLINFVKKKTTGTALLFITYLFFGLSALSNTLSFYFQVVGTHITFSYILSIFSTILPLVAWIFFYIFSARHIIRDSEIVQSLTVYGFSTYSGVLLALPLAELLLYRPEQPMIIVANILSEEIVKLSISLELLLPYILIQIYIFSKISYRAFVLSKKAKDKIRSRALQLVVIGIVMNFLTGTIIGGAYGLENYLLKIISWSLRLLLLMVSYICLYLGWVMPNWYKKMIREKSWFEVQYEKSL